MKSLFFILAILFSLDVGAHQKPQIPQEILESSEQGVVNVIAGRAYLRPEKLMFFENRWFLQNDLQQWNLLGGEVLEDSIGHYLYARAQCPKGHDIPRTVRFGGFGLSETKPNRSFAFRPTRSCPKWAGQGGGSIWRSRSQSKFTKPNGSRYRFKRVSGTWYCLEEDCPYFYGNNF